VYYSTDLTSSEASVQVYVEPSEIVAVISGGTRRDLLPGRFLKLDASSSYDLDLSQEETPDFTYR
jgi:hypothetical protein